MIRCPTQKVVFCLKNVTVSWSHEGQPAGKGEDIQSSDEHAPLTSAPVVLVNDATVCALMCRDGKSRESLLERRAMRTLAAQQNYQTALGTFLKFVKKRAIPLVEDVETDGCLVAEVLMLFL